MDLQLSGKTALVTGGSEGALRVWNIDGANSHERELPHVGHRRLVSGV